MEKLSLSQVLFYLFILEFDNQSISDMTLNSIQNNIYGTINGSTKQVMISDLKCRLINILGTSYRDEFVFGLTSKDFPSINPKYYGKNITYQLSRDKGEISLYNVIY